MSTNKFKARDFFKDVDLGEHSPESLTTVKKIIAYSKASDLELCTEIKRLKKIEAQAQKDLESFQPVEGTLTALALVMSQDDMHALGGLKRINSEVIKELVSRCNVQEKTTEKSNDSQG
ncbi:hypothetical protein [Leptothoe kymatousa]|uniref:Uncharacterized protein n=1 Tax=Leptothoe kymatousa TAU-MAC 1615 TaxID=2364775 RepID=A0ABS5Y3Y9_9CYAN|nr:hypothetical protein [Leptothoe kymatousa]MBT9312542.1 hypothetical protein [Leptothoe kymatousa TAU-MAC 1615]